MVAFLGLLLVVAEPLRNLGKYTMADVLTARFNTREVRSVTALSTVTISITCMIGQLVGAGAIVGPGEISGADPGVNLAAPQLTQTLGGTIFFAFISTVAFATILAVVAGLVISAPSAFSHDFYANVIRGGEASDQEQLCAARIAAVGVSVISIDFALTAQGINMAILVVLTFAVATSANVPVILLTLFWKKFNTVGAVTGMLVGVVASLGLILIGSTVMGEGAFFPLGNPALVSVPLGFLACYPGTVLSSTRAREERE